MATSYRTRTFSTSGASVTPSCSRRQHSVLQPVLPVAFVSATSLGVDAEVRGMVRPSVPNYALRRFVVGAVAAMMSAVAIAGAFGGFADAGGASVSAADGRSTSAEVQRSASIHVAQPGDTLWSIAETHRGDVDRGRFIDVLIRLNGDTGVIAGEAIWLP